MNVKTQKTWKENTVMISIQNTILKNNKTNATTQKAQKLIYCLIICQVVAGGKNFKTRKDVRK